MAGFAVSGLAPAKLCDLLYHCMPERTYPTDSSSRESPGRGMHRLRRAKAQYLGAEACANNRPEESDIQVLEQGQGRKAPE
jgi:hypothetical protein